MSSTTQTDLLPQVSTGIPPKSHTDTQSVRLMDSGGGTLTNGIIKKKQQKLNIATWNVRTLNDSKNPMSITIPRRTALVAKELNTYNIDIASLQETHLKGFGKMEEKSSGYTYYWSGTEIEDNRHGVAICVKTSLVKKGIVTEPTCINERLMSIEILERNSKTAFISCYAPTEVDDSAQKDKFYEDLGSLLHQYPKKYNIIIAGDLNARVGQNQKQWPQVIGKHGPDKHMNDNGRRLLNFCAIEGLCIPISWFQQKNKRKTTWKHPQSKDWHMIDYIIVREGKRKDVLRCRTMRGAECGSDHRLVRATMKLTPKIIPKRNKVTPKFNSRCLKNDDTKKKFKDNLQRNTHMNIDADTMEVAEETWKHIKSEITNAAEACMEKVKGGNQDWFDENDEVINELLKRKKEAYQKWLDKPTEENEATFTQIRRKCQRDVRQIRDQWWSEKAKEIQVFMDMGDSYNVYKSIKALVGPTKRPLNIIIDDDGNRIENLDDRLKEWSEYFKKLFNQENDTDPTAIAFPTIENDPLNDEAPTIIEIQRAISHLKNNKSPGADNITAEMIKAGEECTVDLLHKLYLQIWAEKRIPNDWKQALIVPIHKKGSKNKCSNYRGISLLSVPSKILSRILYNRLYPLINNLINDTQCGFRGQKSTIDMVFTARQMVEKSLEQNTPLCIAFIDISKAFDSVNRDMLFKILEIVKCPPNTLQILKSFYDRTSSTVKIENCESPSFDIISGVRQGCVIAPLLFILYMQAITQNVTKNGVGGIKIKYRTDTDMISRRNLAAKTKVNEQNIVDLMFADDCALLAKNAAQLQELVNLFVAESKKFGLNVNESKTEIMFINCESSQISIGDHALQEVNCFKYLGSNIQNNGRIDKEVCHRVNAASQAFRNLYQRVWKPHEISLQTKLRIYQTVVISTLLYSSETWTVLEKDLKVLNAFHLKSLRTICRIKWEEMIPNEEVLKRTNMKTITNLIRQKRMRWAGHISRMDSSRTPQQIAFGELLTGKRPQQKPRKRWIDILKNDLKESRIEINEWRDIAQNREEWRKHVNEKVESIQIKTNTAAEQKRAERHHNEDQYIWQCPLCSFEREGKSGRQYVNSHLAQKHKDNQDLTNQIEASKSLECELCNKVYATKAGLSSHMRHNHPDIMRNPIQPIKRRKETTSDQLDSQPQVQLTPQASTSSQQPVAANSLTCTACGRTCKSKAGLMAHQRNVLCKAKLIGQESSDTMDI
ncbi:hypothetical protein WDU94_008893 [Cyamophila willieti]